MGQKEDIQSSQLTRKVHSAKSTQFDDLNNSANVEQRLVIKAPMKTAQLTSDSNHQSFPCEFQNKDVCSHHCTPTLC